MSKSRTTATRKKARRLILTRANAGRQENGLPYLKLQQAVHKARNLRLVTEKQLTTAGFNPKGPNRRAKKRGSS